MREPSDTTRRRRASGGGLLSLATKLVPFHSQSPVVLLALGMVENSILNHLITTNNKITNIFSPSYLISYISMFNSNFQPF